MELRVDDNTRESLLKRNNSLEDWQRLDTVLKTWIESHSSPVTWENVICILVKMKLMNIAVNVQEYLKKQEVIDRYIQEPDFIPLSGLVIGQ